jgi:cell division protein YceG involved in septum cleavage|uniref:endolytic transglycosylase MltG n=1 Tax=Agathobacter sp. TaxID=2021311 RepID=UPI0040258F6F
MDINKALFKFIKIGFTIMIILFVLLATVYLSRTGYDYGYRLFTETAVDEAPGTDILVQIKQGTSNWQVSKLLEEKGLVRDGKLFYLQLKTSAYSKSIKPGVYTLNTSMTPKEMMIVMSGQETQTDETEEATAS